MGLRLFKNNGSNDGGPGSMTVRSGPTKIINDLTRETKIRNGRCQTKGDPSVSCLLTFYVQCSTGKEQLLEG